jgi:hypothetical protein
MLVPVFGDITTDNSFGTFIETFYIIGKEAN